MIPVVLVQILQLLFACDRFYKSDVCVSQSFFMSAQKIASYKLDFYLDLNIPRWINMQKNTPHFFTCKNNVIIIINRGNTCSEILNLLKHCQVTILIESLISNYIFLRRLERYVIRLTATVWSLSFVQKRRMKTEYQST